MKRLIIQWMVAVLLVIAGALPTAPAFAQQGAEEAPARFELQDVQGDVVDTVDVIRTPGDRLFLEFETGEFDPRTQRLAITDQGICEAPFDVTGKDLVDLADVRFVQDDETLVAESVIEERAAPEDEGNVEDITSIPLDTAEVIRRSSSFSILAGLLEEAGLMDRLDRVGPITLFAPTNAAFERLPEGALEELSAEEVREVLLNHIVPGFVLVGDVVEQNIETLPGQDLNVRVTEDVITINDEPVTLTTVLTSNGVLHIVDTVLLPPTVSEALERTAPEVQDTAGMMGTIEGTQVVDVALEDLTANALAYAGQVVRVEAPVEQVIDPTTLLAVATEGQVDFFGFILESDEPTDNEVLVVTLAQAAMSDDLADFEGQEVAVTGLVVPFNIQVLEAQTGIDLPETLFADFDAGPMILATMVQVARDAGTAGDVAAANRLFAIVPDVSGLGLFDQDGSAVVVYEGVGDDREIVACGVIVPPIDEEAEPAETGAAEQETPLVEVQDQPLQNDTLTVGRVVVEEPGFVVVRERTPQGLIGQVLGATRVQAGETSDIEVRLASGSVTAGDTVFVVLHEDTGQQGEFEFPARIGVDTALRQNDLILGQRIQITSGDEAEGATLEDFFIIEE